MSIAKAIQKDLAELEEQHLASPRYQELREMQKRLTVEMLAIKLCHAIEQLPASEEQTALSVEANDLYNMAVRYCKGEDLYP